MFTVNPRSSTPLYEQLEQNILGMIATGVLAADDQLPSVRSLARELGMNPNTVQKAYSRLEARGVVYQAAGKGSFVASVEAAVEHITKEAIESLRVCMTQARQSGVTYKSVLELAQSVYGEGRTC